ncbi:DUF3560 domain-containing protein [Neoaquamicrobium sediminum]|uniref:DUF3560 domain-containing protein n=1 Tax=Neoaquamicrobium sediminum TaxID=1849104 RepID=UPI00156669AD|nr:DUF3560 domain-containing protein [Mesorhizobium sediminum]NRC54185.1 DUF3560 domain-containing protein [Mesorhizobium sediminum]
MITYTATYSPEDNKLRLYASSRLDAETFARVKATGFVWAPKQELFVAPKWSPRREDLLIELAGEIEPEEMTIAERAQAKAERLDDLAHKRHREANAFNRAAQQLSEAFSHGQPILVGHHSERKAMKTKERMDSAQAKANKAAKLADYWLYRAEGVERHANRKNDPKVRARRIKTLLAELRDLQGKLNDCHAALAFWDRVTDDATIVKAANYGKFTKFGDYGALQSGEKTPQGLRAERIEAYQKALDSGYWERWISHTLNRLSYERELLGTVARHEGELRETAIQMFAREHGAHKPKATATDMGFVLESSVPLPAHIASGKTLELSPDEWRDLMRDCGYSIPDVKRNEKPSIVNVKAAGIMVNRFGKRQILPVVEMTKAEYGKIYSEQRGTFFSADGTFRVKVCPNPRTDVPRYMAGWCAVFLTDSKVHPKPDSDCVLDAMPEAAE